MRDLQGYPIDIYRYPQKGSAQKSKTNQIHDLISNSFSSTLKTHYCTINIIIYIFISDHGNLTTDESWLKFNNLKQF